MSQTLPCQYTTLSSSTGCIPKTEWVLMKRRGGLSRRVTRLQLTIHHQQLIHSDVCMLMQRCARFVFGVLYRAVVMAVRGGRPGLLLAPSAPYQMWRAPQVKRCFKSGEGGEEWGWGCSLLFCRKRGLVLCRSACHFNRGCASAKREADTGVVWDGSRERREGASCLQSCHSRAEQQHRATLRRVRSPSPAAHTPEGVPQGLQSRRSSLTAPRTKLF